jgi:uncharacterized membrane protein
MAEEVVTEGSAGAVTPAGKVAVRKSQWPEVNPLAVSDIVDSIAAGLTDFRAAPKFGLFFGGIYALGGLLITTLLLFYDLPYLVYPLAMSFVLIAPFVATGLYDVSRKLLRREPLSWNGVLGSVWGASGRDMGWMALVTAFTLIIWMDIAALLFFGFFGGQGISTPDLPALFRDIVTTPSGLLFLAIGNTVGAIIALFVFSFSAVSFPMLYDRDVDFVTAMVTSVRTVTKNFGPMVLWAAIIGALMIISLLAGFLPLFVVLPVLGHATFHLYRRAVAPAVAKV